MWPWRWGVSDRQYPASSLRVPFGTGISFGQRNTNAGKAAARQSRRDIMTNRIALFIGVSLIALIVLDVLLFGTEHIVFLGKKMFDLIEWMAFWR
jgi:hypothetical protein